MRFQINAADQNGNAVNVPYEDLPDTCPTCHNGINPRLMAGVFHGSGLTDAAARLEIAFQCTKHQCGRMFVGTYLHRQAGSDHFFALSSVAPWKAKQKRFPDTVEKISPLFVKIYNQAIAAEALRLDQLTGIGLRKALEFLVKDFACREHPDQEDEIRKERFGTCINEYIQDSNVKECAKRAAWLGNDETHYTRKWEDKDINDLKTLVRLTVNWLDNVLLTRRYIEEMEEGKTPAVTAEGRDESTAP